MRPDPVPQPSAAPPAGRRPARLALVLSLTPGAVITMILAPGLRSPVLLAAGLALVILAVLAHGPLSTWIFARCGDQGARASRSSRPQPPEIW
ncbi:hypothetical protein [Caulobacter soli]|uniref:hypothetical protein n=1 Tax=Caulobacter soli TaxID=2708539 RepID=UPI0013EACC22|nr:hypothetical protein [Caulobacter soli]